MKFMFSRKKLGFFIWHLGKTGANYFPSIKKGFGAVAAIELLFQVKAAAKFIPHILNFIKKVDKTFTTMY